MLEGALPPATDCPATRLRPLSPALAGAGAPGWRPGPCSTCSTPRASPSPGSTVGSRRGRLGRRPGDAERSGFSIVDHLALRRSRRPRPLPPGRQDRSGRSGRTPRCLSPSARQPGRARPLRPARQSPRSSRSRPDARPVVSRMLPARLASPRRPARARDRIVVVPWPQARSVGRRRAFGSAPTSLPPTERLSSSWRPATGQLPPTPRSRSARVDVPRPHDGRADRRCSTGG